MEKRDVKKAPGEKLIWAGKPVPLLSYMILLVLSAFVLAALSFSHELGDLAVPIAGALIVLAFFFYLSAAFTDYELTENFVRARNGILIKNSTGVRIKDIRNIQMRGRVPIFRIGSVPVGTAAPATFEVELANVRNPENVRDLIRARLEPGEA